MTPLDRQMQDRIMARDEKIMEKNGQKVAEVLRDMHTGPNQWGEWRRGKGMNTSSLFGLARALRVSVVALVADLEIINDAQAEICQLLSCGIHEYSRMMLQVVADPDRSAAALEVFRSRLGADMRATLEDCCRALTLEPPSRKDVGK